MGVKEDVEHKFNKFVSFFKSNVDDKNGKILQLINLRYSECASHFKYSTGMLHLLTQTKKLMKTDQKRNMVHLKDFIQELKAYTKKRKIKHSDKDGDRVAKLRKLDDGVSRSSSPESFVSDSESCKSDKSRVARLQKFESETFGVMSPESVFSDIEASTSVAIPIGFVKDLSPDVFCQKDVPQTSHDMQEGSNSAENSLPELNVKRIEGVETEDNLVSSSTCDNLDNQKERFNRHTSKTIKMAELHSVDASNENNQEIVNDVSTREEAEVIKDSQSDDDCCMIIDTSPSLSVENLADKSNLMSVLNLQTASEANIIKTTAGPVNNNDLTTEDVSGSKDEASCEKKDEEEDEEKKKKKKEKHIKKLENTIEKLKNKIEEVRNQELSLDDLDDEMSSYIFEDKLEKKFVAIWNKLCELKGRRRTTGRPVEKIFSYSGSRYPEINKKVERVINKSKEFPDFHDIKTLVKKVNRKSNLGLNNSQVDMVSREVFIDVGNMLQERRHEDFMCTFRCRMQDNFSFERDPALYDRELQHKLEQNRLHGKNNLEQVINKYADKQFEIMGEGGMEEQEDDDKKDGAASLHDEDEDDDDEEEDEEEDDDIEDVDQFVEITERLTASAPSRPNSEEEESHMDQSPSSPHPSKSLVHREGNENKVNPSVDSPTSPPSSSITMETKSSTNMSPDSVVDSQENESKHFGFSEPDCVLGSDPRFDFSEEPATPTEHESTDDQLVSNAERSNTDSAVDLPISNPESSDDLEGADPTTIHLASSDDPTTSNLECVDGAVSDDEDTRESCDKWKDMIELDIADSAESTSPLIGQSDTPTQSHDMPLKQTNHCADHPESHTSDDSTDERRNACKDREPGNLKSEIMMDTSANSVEKGVVIERTEAPDDMKELETKVDDSEVKELEIKVDDSIIDLDDLSSPDSQTFEKKPSSSTPSDSETPETNDDLSEEEQTDDNVPSSLASPQQSEISNRENNSTTSSDGCESKMRENGDKRKLGAKVSESLLSDPESDSENKPEIDDTQEDSYKQLPNTSTTNCVLYKGVDSKSPNNQNPSLPQGKKHSSVEKTTAVSKFPKVPKTNLSNKDSSGGWLSKKTYKITNSGCLDEKETTDDIVIIEEFDIPPLPPTPKGKLCPSTAKSHPSTAKPHPSTAKSHPSTAKPHPSTAKPHPSTAKPHSFIAQSRPQNANPHSSNVQVQPGNYKPVNRSVNPLNKNMNNFQGNVNVQRGNSGQSNTCISVKPIKNSSINASYRPCQSSFRSYTNIRSNVTPVNTTVRPGNTNVRLGNTSAKPVNMNNKPVNINNRQAHTSNRPDIYTTQNKSSCTLPVIGNTVRHKAQQLFSKAIRNMNHSAKPSSIISSEDTDDQLCSSQVSTSSEEATFTKVTNKHLSTKIIKHGSNIDSFVIEIDEADRVDSTTSTLEEQEEALCESTTADFEDTDVIVLSDSE